MNLSLDYWKTRFLYPFALDKDSLKANEGVEDIDEAEEIKQAQALLKKKESQIKHTVNVLESDRFQFPLTQLENKAEHLNELQKPISLTVDDVIKDMYEYRKKFPREVIPHITASHQINDIIHNYKSKNNIQNAGI